MRSENGKTIGKPRGWLISKVKKGYYPAPANFVSFNEEQQQQIQRSKEIRARNAASQEQGQQEQPAQNPAQHQKTEEEKKQRFQQGRKAVAEILDGLRDSEDNTERKLFEKDFGPWYDKLSEDERCKLTRATLGKQSEKVYELCQFRALRLCFARHQNLNRISGKLAKEAYQVILDFDGGYYEGSPEKPDALSTEDYGDTGDQSPMGEDLRP